MKVFCAQSAQLCGRPEKDIVLALMSGTALRWHRVSSEALLESTQPGSGILS